MGSLLTAAYALAAVFSVASVVCFILVLVEMFRRGKTGLAIACIILAVGTTGAWIFAKGMSNVEEANRHLQESPHQQEMEKMAKEMEKMAEDGALDIKIE